MKKLLTLACGSAALALPATTHAGPVDYGDADITETTTYQREPHISSVPYTGLTAISYDYVEAAWAYTSLDNFDDSNGASLGLSVSIADNAYIKLFGTIQDDTSNAGFSIGLHHEMLENVDLYADVGGFYEEISSDFGPYTELGGRWLTCKWFEIDAGVGLQYIDSDTEFYGIVRALVPIYKGLSFAASAMLEDRGQIYGAGFRLNF